MSDDKNPKKKPFSLKEIGLPKLLTLVAAGVLLLILSVPDFLSLKGDTQSGSDTKGTAVVEHRTDETSVYVENMEQKLETALRKVKGIGDVDVMLTVKSSKERVALKDDTDSQTSNSETDSGGGTRVETSIDKSEQTVMSQAGGGGNTPYVVKELEPELEGVLVIAEGGNDARIISEINSAVQVLFDVPAHKIKVMKMM